VIKAITRDSHHSSHISQSDNSYRFVRTMCFMILVQQYRGKACLKQDCALQNCRYVDRQYVRKTFFCRFHFWLDPISKM